MRQFTLHPYFYSIAPPAVKSSCVLDIVIEGAIMC